MAHLKSDNLSSVSHLHYRNTVFLGALPLNAAAACVLPARGENRHVSLSQKLDAACQIIQRLRIGAKVLKERFQRNRIITKHGFCFPITAARSCSTCSSDRPFIGWLIKSLLLITYAPLTFVSPARWMMPA